MNGYINLLKPPGLTSHDMVNYIRKLLNIKKVGHGGTLDPGAAGVLVIGIGNGTKLLEDVTGLVKQYRAEATIGISTSSADAFGKVINEIHNVQINKDSIHKVINNYKGVIEQVPPMTSAKKHKGKKLYQFAREGIEIEREPRRVNIYALRLVDIFENEFPKIILDIECSKGTYIRTLCEDIGTSLGWGAYMSFLVRTKVGIFSINDSLTPDEIKYKVNNNDYSFIYPLSSAVSFLKKVVVKEKNIKSVLNGASININNLYDNLKLKNDTRITIYDEKGNFTAIGKVDLKNNSIKPIKVFGNKG
jgi:tRNA pseudouridine55 synthase